MLARIQRCEAQCRTGCRRHRTSTSAKDGEEDSAIDAAMATESFPKDSIMRLKAGWDWWRELSARAACGIARLLLLVSLL
jgi:hypothetical protein